MSKLWLDDVRPAPEGWYWAKTVPEAQSVFHTGKVTEASLDHDLGKREDGTGRDLPNGHDLLCWMEHKMGTGNWPWPIPKLTVHSDNASGIKKMRLAIESIERINA